MRQKHDTIESHQNGQDYRVHKNHVSPLNVLGFATHRSGQGLGRGPYHGNRSIELGPGARRSGPDPGKLPGAGARRSGLDSGKVPGAGARRSGPDPGKVPGPGAWRDGPTRRTHRSGLSPGRGPYHGNCSIELGPGACRSGTNPEKVPGPGA